ncbi:MAG: VOC family protein [Candidatus Synoicihabitans palmerolidicus]|nr:VOC family protein [Candidatus Synoicihabitans palmerolidicus]
MSIEAKEIAFSCYAISDFDRALKFYQDTLGLKLDFAVPSCDGPRWAEFDIAGVTLAIGQAPGMEPASTAVPAVPSPSKSKIAMSP